MVDAEIPSKDALDLIAGKGMAAFAIDRLDRIVYWNHAAELLLGHRAKDVIGLPPFEVLAGRDPFGNFGCPHDCAILEAAAKGETVQPYLMDVKKSSGSSRRIFIRLAALLAPGPSFSCLMHFIGPVESTQVDRSVAALRRGSRFAARSAAIESELSLTARQIEILALLSDGFAALNIAARLNLSHATVRNHIQNILRKLDVHSQAEALAVAFRRGWV